MQEKINALKLAVELSPENHPLRQLLAEAYQEAGQHASALEQYEQLVAAHRLPENLYLPIGEYAVEHGNPTLGRACLDAAIREGITTGVSALRSKLDAHLEDQGAIRATEGDLFSQAVIDKKEEEPTITFADVGGMDDVKKMIHKMIILPFMRPEVYKKYGRSSGGGVLMFGPPGCGKTMLARATAGECGLPFINVRIEDILDPYRGVSERNLHNVFERARALSPCVLFFDEMDAIGIARRKHSNATGRAIVDQLLQEMDSIGSDNTDILFLAASNAPWDIDDALLRPGRFDRSVFITPPDLDARNDILQLMMTDVPQSKLNLKAVAKDSVLYSGADLRALVDVAIDQVIDEALETGTEPPVQMKHLQQGLKDVRPSTIEWLQRVQSFVEFANDSGRYDDVATYLNQRDIKRRLA